MQARLEGLSDAQRDVIAARAENSAVSGRHMRLLASDRLARTFTGVCVCVRVRLSVFVCVFAM